jgi:Ca-activated chloride channel family protein
MGRKMMGAVALLAVGIAAIVIFKLSQPFIDRTGSSSLKGTRTENVPEKINTISAVTISIASSNTKEEWLEKVTERFNRVSEQISDYQIDGRPIHVDIIKETVDGKLKDYRSGTMIDDTLKGKIRPTILSPGSESWVAKFIREWKSLHGTHPISETPQIVVRTPVVIAMWRSRAKTMGCYPESGPDCTWKRIGRIAADPKGWQLFNRPEWGPFSFGYGAFGESNSGTMGIVSVCMAGAGRIDGLSMTDIEEDSGCGKMIADIEAAKVHSGKSDLWLLERMVAGGQNYLDAVITYESNVIAINRKYGEKLPEPLISVYPQDGTVLVGHPMAILDSVPWVVKEQAAAARIYKEYLLAREQQEQVLELGLRPGIDELKLTTPIDPAYGADANAKIKALKLPETLIIDRIGEVWHGVKKKAVIVIAFDKSGSMKDKGKIDAARQGAKQFVSLMGAEDILVWLPFDNQIYSDRARGPKHAIGEDLADEINSISANGGTALYDAVLAAFDILKDYRGRNKNTLRYGIVLLSDGRDTAKKSSLAKVEAVLAPQEGDPHGVQIHTICIGADCDEPVLKKIANAAHGRFWKGNSEGDMVKIYSDIAKHY